MKPHMRAAMAQETLDILAADFYTPPKSWDAASGPHHDSTTPFRRDPKGSDFSVPSKKSFPFGSRRNAIVFTVPSNPCNCYVAVMEPMKPMTPMKPMEPMKPMQPMRPQERWWPADLGEPSATGSQNDLRYAYFSDARRLAVQEGGKTTLYDTADHRIGGISQQQQNNDGGATFTSQHGDVALQDLKIVNR
jgi:hypothetical protein